MTDSFALGALPPEMQGIIFREILNLPTKEVLKCRQVCSDWKEAIDSLCYDSLTIEWENNPERPNYFRARHEPVLTDGYLAFKTNAFLEHLPRQNIFKNIRKMVTSAEDVLSPFQKQFYNHFELLEDLKIDTSAYLAPLQNLNIEMCRIELDLKFLKKLHVTWSDNRFILKTPQLEFLKCQTFDSFTIEHPESIKHLDTYLICPYFTTRYSNRPLRHLETLVIRLNFHADEQFFKRLPQLREVHFQFPFPHLHRYDTDYSRAPIKVQFFFFGIEREHFTNFPKKRSRVFTGDLEGVPFRLNTRFILRNWSVISGQNFCVPDIDYKPLEDALLDLASFYEKFPKVARLALREGVKNESNLLGFLEKTKPEALLMRICKMNQSLLNDLPKRFRFIRKLKLDLAGVTNIDRLEFVFEMKCLNTFNATQFFSFTFLKRLVYEIGSLTGINFDFNTVVI